ncbi:hypothetical protein Hanom_Chr17g01576821 [Helianthus anomalus]
MDMHSDPDPTMPPTWMSTHPISISSGSSYAGSPYKGPDSWAERWNNYKWEFTPSFHNSPPQPPLEEPYLQAVTPPPLPVEEPPKQPPQPPPEPPRRRRNARMSVRGGLRFSSPQASSTYPPIPKDPQMGGPSHAMPEMIPHRLPLHHRHRQWVMKTQYILTQVHLGITHLNTKLQPRIHILRQLNLTPFIPHRFLQHTQQGIQCKGTNTLLISINLHLLLNILKPKKFYKGWTKLRKKQRNGKRRPINFLRVLQTS